MRPYPRESIAAASWNERSSASCSTGIAMPRTARRPRAVSPRSFARPADALHALDELRRDRDRDGDRDAELVERGGQDAQRALRIGERVGRADAAQQRGEAEAVVDARRRTLSALTAPPSCTPDMNPGSGICGSVKQHVLVRARVAAEHDAERRRGSRSR